MGFPEAVAFCALVVGLISISGILLDAHNRRLKHREKELELQVRLAEAQGRKGSGEVAQLEQRLRVLERIATDKGSTLAAEIEDLRERADAR
ncbi:MULTISPECIES: hypothetical protein [unclassified Novosphingobium]|uniref:hypothetical protein n=1 Tax=unclassified Novosphingobium TaxID=2644732 RepID=UPI000ECFA311|nr:MULTISPECIES: hypothetical protein [unclassified Novosphingobium]HCF25510.1 hypothetical protein [Novosphingobium sp.]HQV04786.1 hypothetical protein [Novosphingobium sp.]